MEFREQWSLDLWIKLEAEEVYRILHLRELKLGRWPPSVVIRINGTERGRGIRSLGHPEFSHLCVSVVIIMSSLTRRPTVPLVLAGSVPLRHQTQEESL